MDMDVTSVFPVVWKLTGKRVLVVGGGKVAERKAASLLEAGADVLLISPEITEQLAAWVELGRIGLRRKSYEQGDADESFVIVMAAANSRETNAQVMADARKCRVPALAADDPDDSDFYMPSVMRRGRLVIAVSTSGASPGLAAQICGELADTYGEEYEDCLDFLQEYRLKVKRMVKDASKRRRLLRDVLTFDLPAQIREGLFEAWRKRLMDELEREAAEAQTEGSALE